MMKSKYTKSLVIVSVLLILVLIISTSYAFFTASVNGTSNNNVVVTGHMEVSFEDGPVIGTSLNMIPGDYITKTFSVTNTGNVDTAYDIYLNEVFNNFNTKSDLVYELISEDGVNKPITECPYENAKIMSDIPLLVGQTHHYVLKITFLNLDRNQDDNKGKAFNTKVQLEESDATFEKLAVFKDNYANEKYLNIDDAYQQSLYSVFVKTSYIGSIDNTTYYYNLYLVSSEGFNTLQECESIINEDELNYFCKYDGNYRIYSFEKAYKTEGECIEKTSSYNIDWGTVKCELNTSDQARQFPNISYEIDDEVCTLSNDQLYCFSGLEPWSNQNIQESEEAINFYNSLNEIDGFECEYGVDGVVCTGNQGSKVRYQSDGLVRIEENQLMFDIIKLDLSQECNDIYNFRSSGYSCGLLNGKYYRIIESSSFQPDGKSNKKECEDYIKDDEDKVCAPRSRSDSQFYCEISLDSSRAYCSYLEEGSF